MTAGRLYGLRRGSDCKKVPGETDTPPGQVRPREWGGMPAATPNVSAAGVCFKVSVRFFCVSGPFFALFLGLVVVRTVPVAHEAPWRRAVGPPHLTQTGRFGLA